MDELTKTNFFFSGQINLLFLVNIVRILITKLKDNSSHQNEGVTHVRKALRATLILFPLLGMTNLLFFINPKDGTHDKIYVIFNATMQSSQVSLVNLISVRHYFILKNQTFLTGNLFGCSLLFSKC